MDAPRPGRRYDADALDAWLETLGYSISLLEGEAAWVYTVSRRGGLESPPETWRGEGADPDIARDAVVWQMFPSRGAREALVVALAERRAPWARESRPGPETRTSPDDQVDGPRATAPGPASHPGGAPSTPAEPCLDETLARSREAAPCRGSIGPVVVADAVSAASDETDPSIPRPPAEAIGREGVPLVRGGEEVPRSHAPELRAPTDGSSPNASADSPFAGAPLTVERTTGGGAESPGASPVASPSSPFASPGSSHAALRRPREPALSREEAIERIDALEETVRGSRDAIGTLASYGQRMVILGWVAEAREIQDAARGDPEVFARVQALVRYITDAFCKVLWPGSVRALRLEAQPWDTIDDLAPVDRPVECPRTWGEVARLVHAIEKRFDDEGWADDRALRPEPRCPEAVLDQVVGEISKVDGLPSRAELERWARYLRWVREATERPWTWGQTFGQLRRWAAEDRRLAVDELREEYAPPRGSTWASLLGHDPERKRRRDEFRRIMRHYPRPEDNPPDIARQDWLRRALVFWSTHRDILVARIRADGSWARDVDANELLERLNDRAARRAFRKLLDELNVPEWDADHDQRVLADYEREEEEESSVPDVADDDDDGFDADEADPRRARFRCVADRTRGCSALFITNRGLDEGLRDELVRDLELSCLEWLECESLRKLESVAKSIEAGSYGLVIGATGFMSHSADRILRQAARKGGVPYIAANRARRQACLLAIERDLGARPREQNGSSVTKQA